MNFIKKFAVNTNPNTFPYKPTKNWVHFDRRKQRTWIKDADGNILSENYSVSGKPGYTDPEYEQLKNQGPIPAGDYTFSPKKRIVHDKSFVQAVANYANPFNYTSVKKLKSGMAGGEVAWGPYHWDIAPKAGTQTYGRGGFTMHGGWIPGSIGCIDFANPFEGPYSTISGIKYLVNKNGKSDAKIMQSLYNIPGLAPYLLLNNENRLYPNANENLESFRSNVEKYLRDQDEVLLRVSKRFKNKPNMTNIDNTKLAAFSGQELMNLAKNKENVEKLKDPFMEFQSNLQSSAKTYTQNATRNFFQNLSFLDKFKILLSQIFGFKSNILEKFKAQQAQATQNFVKQNLSGLKDSFEKKYGKGSFRNALTTGTPTLQEHVKSYKMQGLQATDNQNDNSLNGMFSNFMYEQALPQVNESFDKSWVEQQSAQPMSNQEKSNYRQTLTKKVEEANSPRQVSYKQYQPKVIASIPGGQKAYAAVKGAHNFYKNYVKPAGSSLTPVWAKPIVRPLIYGAESFVKGKTNQFKSYIKNKIYNEQIKPGIQNAMQNISDDQLKEIRQLETLADKSDTY